MTPMGAWTRRLSKSVKLRTRASCFAARELNALFAQLLTSKSLLLNQRRNVIREVVAARVPRLGQCAGMSPDYELTSERAECQGASKI